MAEEVVPDMDKTAGKHACRAMCRAKSEAIWKLKEAFGNEEETRNKIREEKTGKTSR